MLLMLKYFLDFSIYGNVPLSVSCLRVRAYLVSCRASSDSTLNMYHAIVYVRVLQSTNLAASHASTCGYAEYIIIKAIWYPFAEIAYSWISLFSL